MNTTLLFAELLITGLHTGLWLLLLALNIFGLDWLQSLLSKGVSEWATAILVSLLAVFYIFGIVFDRFADFVFFRWDKKIREKIIPNAPLRINVMRFQLAKDNEYLNRQFEYTRSRMRIVRAATLNFAISTILLLLLIILKTPDSSEKIGYILVSSIIGILLTFGSIFAWYKLTQSYFKLVKSNWDLYLTQQNQTLKRALQRKRD